MARTWLSTKTHRTGNGGSLTRQVGIPQSPVQIGTFDIRGVNRLTGRFRQSSKNVLFAPVNYDSLDFDHSSTLARLVTRGVIQVRINNHFWIPWPTGFACRSLRTQFVKQFTQDCAVMGQFVRDKQGLALAAVGQVRKHLAGVV